MDISQLWTNLVSQLSGILPGLLAAVAILLIGWIVAAVLRAGTRKALRFAALNRRLGLDPDKGMDVEGAIGAGVFWVVMLIVLVAFFERLELGAAAEPLQTLLGKVFDFAPNLISGGVLALIAWAIATFGRKAVTKALAGSKLDRAISTESESSAISGNLGDVFYWVVILLFLPAILGVLKLGGLLAPVQSMLTEVLGMLPNIIGAAVIGVVGWFVARLLRDIVTSLLGATRIDELGTRAGLADSLRLSRVLGLVVFIFVFVPALIGALNALQIEAISGPAQSMLSRFMGALPNIVAATLIVVIAVFVARLISGIVAMLLEGAGADTLPQKLGLPEQGRDAVKLSAFAGKLVSAFIILFSLVEAGQQLGFTRFSALIGDLIEFAGQVLLGSVILVIGFWLSSLAHSGIRRLGGKNSESLAGLARFGILGLVLAMGLRTMGIADDIVNLAFALVLGSIAVAVALSFGLGGREAAGRQMEHWLARLRGE